MIVRRILIALAGCAALVMVAVLGVAACIDAGLFRSAVIRFISIRAGRPIGITGPLRIHLFVRHPNLSAEGVTIGNPPWVPAGQFAQVGEISLAMDAPWFDGAFGIVGLSMKSAETRILVPARRNCRFCGVYRYPTRRFFSTISGGTCNSRESCPPMAGTVPARTSRSKPSGSSTDIPTRSTSRAIP
jgi:hypothetical protein